MLTRCDAHKTTQHLHPNEKSEIVKVKREVNNNLLNQTECIVNC